MDKMKTKSLTSGICSKIITCLTHGGNAGTIDNLVVDAVEIVLEAEKKRRENRASNVPLNTDLLTEQHDEQGRRRYQLAAIDDEPVMVPDKVGFWTPANG